LSWCKIQASGQSSGLLRRTDSRNFANISKQQCWLTVRPCSRNSKWTIFICPVSFRTSSSFVVFHVFSTLFKPFMPLKDTLIFHSISTISLC
jgi:hypothetical protein